MHSNGNFIELCLIDDLPKKGAKGLGYKGLNAKYFAIQKDGEIFIYLNSCPHNLVPLEYRKDKFLTPCEEKIICYAHGAQFDIKTGECISGVCKGEYLTPIEFINDGKSIKIRTIG